MDEQTYQRKQARKRRIAAYVWQTALADVNQRYPILNELERHFPEHVAKLRRAMANEHILVERLAHKSKANPEYNISRSFGRVARKTAKLQEKTTCLMTELLELDAHRRQEDESNVPTTTHFKEEGR